jgi:hypothetical protein
MRQLRLLKQGVWYEIRPRINKREALFRQPKAYGIFEKGFDYRAHVPAPSRRIGTSFTAPVLDPTANKSVLP